MNDQRKADIQELARDAGNELAAKQRKIDSLEKENRMMLRMLKQVHLNTSDYAHVSERVLIAEWKLQIIYHRISGVLEVLEADDGSAID